MVLAVDDGGALCHWNQECELLTGYALPEVEGRQATAILFRAQEVMDGTLARFFSAHVEACAPARLTRVIVTRSGRRRHITWTRRLVHDDDGQRRCVLTGMDVTECRVEAFDSESQAFLARAGQALASSLDYPETLRTVVRLATKDVADACIMEVFESKDVVRVHADHRDLTKRPLMRRLCGSGSTRSSRILCFPSVRVEDPILWTDIEPDDLRAVVPDHDDARVFARLALRSLLTVPLRARGRWIGTLTLLAEHSDRGFDERDLRVAEDFAREAAFAIDNARLYRSARDAILTRDQVLATVAHDLRNPLNEIVLAIELLASSHGHPSQIATRVRRSAERMQRLIRDLLDIGAIERGCLQLERRAIAPGELVREAVCGVRELAERRDIALQLTIPAELPQVEVDPDRILQVLGNLFDNALRFTPVGGQIHVIASAHARSVKLRIVDNGPGIPVDELPHVFDRFFHRARSRGGGNGLGLAISKSLIEAHGGRIWIRNMDPHGAAFCLTLPLASSPGD